jgi:D-tyrosyl-tRNA(Tyr) deacylase
MRAVVQRVSQANVRVAGEIVGEISRGLLVLLGVEQGDELADAIYLADKICELRIFEDEAGKLNLSLCQIAGELLVVSQFTLLGDCRKGRRPGFSSAAEPARAAQLYEMFVELTRKKGIAVATGRFREQMQVMLVNDGPVTLLLDSRKVF